MEIIFENNEIVVAVKPAGISSEDNGKNNMVQSLKAATNSENIYTVHRLDTVTSGVMVYAKTKKAAAFLSSLIAADSFHKEYHAVVHGILTNTKGTMEDFLFRDAKKNKSFVVKKERKGVKKASLDYEVIATDNDLSLVKINLHTGRTHQIRVQFASRKHPVYGDGKYGASDNIPAIALFASSLTFTEPESGKEMTFSAPLPFGNYFPL